MLFPFLMTVVLPNSVLRNWPAWLATYGFFDHGPLVLPEMADDQQVPQSSDHRSRLVTDAGGGVRSLYFRYLDTKGRRSAGTGPAWMTVGSFGVRLPT